METRKSASTNVRHKTLVVIMNDMLLHSGVEFPTAAPNDFRVHALCYRKQG